MTNSHTITITIDELDAGHIIGKLIIARQSCPDGSRTDTALQDMITEIKSQTLSQSEAARALRKAAKSDYEHGLKAFAGDDHMIEVANSDYTDLLHIAELISNGNWAGAAREAKALDTAIADIIPAEVALRLSVEIC